ncbi:hypothetical protein GGQ97_002428 [Sphingomonas kaistensis]|uniref:Lipoprotein n=1 Tax=Sphingomonas kaistensis TaxID=298708 RepID=A0A7X6BHK9_9SPHN|nr:hypothetical protein [Sphingomonas kaistensis]NJC06635.1 hypothetical protein [Sphingomonas kaistensis]
MSCKLLPIAVAAVLLAGCNTVDARTGSVDRQFGEAVAWNKAVQTINPDPVVTADAAPVGSDGAKAAAASQRYRTDKVKQVERIGTSSGGAASGSGPQ